MDRCAQCGEGLYEDVSDHPCPGVAAQEHIADALAALAEAVAEGIAALTEELRDFGRRPDRS